MKRRIKLACAAVLALAGTVAMAQVKGDAAKGKEIVDKTCVACHGADGNGPVPNFPKLAGMDANYMLKQLQEFKNKRRPSDIMTPIAGELSADDMANTAVYFASQKPAAGFVKEAGLLDAGKALWVNGNPGSGVPACGSCHGDKGQGDDRYPRLAGQYAEYTIDQLNLFKTGKRKNDKRQMQAIADRLSEQEMKEVAEYAASLQQ